MRRVGHEEGAGVAAAGDAQGDPRLHGALPRGRGQRRQRSRQAQHGGPRAAGPPPAARCYWRSRLSLIQTASPIGQEAGSESRRTTTINRAGRARAHRGHARPATAPGRRLRTLGSRGGCGQSEPIRASHSQSGWPGPVWPRPPRRKEPVRGRCRAAHRPAAADWLRAAGREGRERRRGLRRNGPGRGLALTTPALTPPALTTSVLTPPALTTSALPAPALLAPVLTPPALPWLCPLRRCPRSLRPYRDSSPPPAFRPSCRAARELPPREAQAVSLCFQDLRCLLWGLTCSGSCGPAQAPFRAPLSLFACISPSQAPSSLFCALRPR